MYRPFLILACAGMVALTAPHATARPRAMPSVLTHTEALCEALGQFTYARGNDRDNGFPLFTVLRLSRMWDQAHAVEPATRHAHETLIQAIYANPLLPPRLLQQQTEVVCTQTLTHND